MKCPVDGETLMIAERSGVEIDYCPKCRGVWLDRGELDKIIDRSAEAAPAPRPAPAGSREYPAPTGSREYQDGRPQKKRRESFLGELFDF